YDKPRRSGANGLHELRGHWQVECGLLHPAAGVGGTVPAFQADALDVFALLVVEQIEVRSGEASSHLGRGAAEVDEPFGAVVKDGDRTPTLWLRFGLIEHGF